MEGGRVEKSLTVIDAQLAIVREAKRILKQRLKKIEVRHVISIFHSFSIKYFTLTVKH